MSPEKSKEELSEQSKAGWSHVFEVQCSLATLVDLLNQYSVQQS